MDFNKLVPIEARRTNPDTGHEFTFRVAPPVDLIDDEKRFGLEIKDPREFAINFFWRALIGEWDVFNVNNFEQDIRTIFPLLKEVVRAIVIVRKKVDSTDDVRDGYQYTYFLTSFPSLLERDGMSEAFVNSLLKEVMVSPATQMVMSWYLNANPLVLDDTPYLEEMQADDQGEGVSKIDRLFPNSKNIDLKKQFAMPKFIADRLNQGVKGISRQDAIAQYEASGMTDKRRKSEYTVRNKEDDTVFVFDKEKLAIETADQFTQKLEKLKDPKVIQTHFALMKWMNLKDTSVFINVPLSEIMSLVLKSQDKNGFNKKARQEFSEALELLANVTITVSVIGRRVNKRTGREKTVLQKEDGVKLFRMKAEYSVKKEYQSMPRESLIQGTHFDETVINHFSGEVLPGNQHMFKERGNVYFDTLLQFDANKDSRAIILGFILQTRFNQLSNKEKYQEMDRAYLIELCEYQQTDHTKPSKATKQLANNLDKLIKAGIISKYTELTNKNEDKIRIYPPQQKALPGEA